MDSDWHAGGDRGDGCGKPTEWVSYVRADRSAAAAKEREAGLGGGLGDWGTGWEKDRGRPRKGRSEESASISTFCGWSVFGTIY